MKMPYLRAGKLNLDWREIWDYKGVDLEVNEVAREFIRQDDLLTKRELARTGE